ncbi:PxKF domain-containing protein [Amycolatopsis halotolerans]|uniref:PxKF domain-containing protein n=1 Tax=Amycolatopsis halotolerans TaxID=330083 RepID=A0ABV7Q8S8_9PSEU
MTHSMRVRKNTETGPVHRPRASRRLTVLTVCGVLAAGMSAVTAVPAQATFPGGSGKIFFTRSSTISSMNPDGTGLATVASGNGVTAPRVSADGTKVAFERHVGSPDYQVFTMNPDGTGATQVTTGASADGQSLAWSPDGTKLAYRNSGTLTVVNADGTGPVSLGVSGFLANWSPDGTRIAYSSPAGTIDTIKPDGTGQTTLISIAGLSLSGPNWSPDGTKITFTALNLSPISDHIHTANADGTNQADISGANNTDTNSVWSPDGALIQFMDNDGLLTMNTDGTNRTRIYSGIAGSFRTGDWAAIPSPKPAVTAVNPASGPKTGGTVVTITGTNFTGATAVAFGATPATSFTVTSATSITATAPASTTAGPVDVAVTTPTGTSTTSPADQYTYTYAFTGFFPPVQNPPAVNHREAGSHVPVKFSLGGNQGLAIFPTGSPSSQQYDCTTGALIGGPAPTTGTLAYDPATDRYQYNWTTDRAWDRTCRHLNVTLADGTTHTADFRFH